MNACLCIYDEDLNFTLPIGLTKRLALSPPDQLIVLLFTRHGDAKHPFTEITSYGSWYFWGDRCSVQGLCDLSSDLDVRMDRTSPTSELKGWGNIWAGWH